jgi:hypothetical protein
MSIVVLYPVVLLINHAAFETVLVMLVTVGVVLPQIVLVSVRDRPASFIERVYPHPHLLGIVVAISAQ